MISSYVRRFPAFIAANIEKIIFLASTVFASIVLAICCVYVFCRQNFGDFIHCSNFEDEKHENNAKPFGTFCFNNIRLPAFEATGNEDDRNFYINRIFYQWAPNIFLYECIWFLIPYLIVHKLNGKTCQSSKVIFEKQIGSIAGGEEGKALTPNNIHYQYQRFLLHLKSNNYSPWTEICAEVLAAILIGVQIYLITTLAGPENLRQEYPFAYAFPKRIKCSLHKYGANGTLEEMVATCDLPINYVNDIIFTYLLICSKWLMVLVLLVLVYRMISFIFYSWSKIFNRFEFSRLCWGSLKQDNLMVASKWGFSRWLILRRLAMEMSGEDFGLLVEALQTAPD